MFSDFSIRKRSTKSRINDSGDSEIYRSNGGYDDLESIKQKENKRSCATTTFLLAIDIFTIALIVILFSKITIKNGKLSGTIKSNANRTLQFYNFNT